MAAYAALTDRVDQEMGRLLRDLEAKGELDNTLVLFFSDNGACPFDSGKIDNRKPYEPGVKWNNSTGWAWARNSPFRLYKQNQFEGGIATPAIVHWPAGMKRKPGALVHSPAHLVDVLPTLAEVANATVPESYSGRTPTPLAGVSLAPILAGKEAAPRPPIHLLYGTDRGLRDGDWKLVSFQSQPWELYNLAEDRTELHDLAGKHPDVLARMAKRWHEMAAEVLHAPAKDREPVTETATGQQNPRWSNYTGAKSPKAGGTENKKRPKKAAAPAAPTNPKKPNSPSQP
jgi:arylsulfatase